jgi:Ca2+/Na+ antiporter
VESNLSLQVSGGFLLVSLLATLFFIPFNKFASHKYHGAFLLALYAAFMITSVTLQFVA